MKQLAFFLFALTFALGISSCRKKGELPKNVKLDTEILVDTTEVTVLDSAAYNFGEIVEGEKAEHTFQLINTGAKNSLSPERKAPAAAPCRNIPRIRWHPGIPLL
ncbi:MAG: hypothetical protein IPH78_14610 [Bacteroidetes bacterium]|nr:hypothetical protein [Bacteroidota bacterium]